MTVSKSSIRTKVMDIEKFILGSTAVILGLILAFNAKTYAEMVFPNNTVIEGVHGVK